MQPNYVRVWAGLFTLVIYLRPAAVVGVAVAAGVAYFNLGLSTGSYQLEPEVRLSVACWGGWVCLQGLPYIQNQHKALSTSIADPAMVNADLPTGCALRRDAQPCRTHGN